MEGMTAEQLIDAVTVVLAVMAAIITVDKILDIVKKWRQPDADLRAALAADRRRLDRNEEDIGRISGRVKALCRAELAHLQHEITGNSVDALKKALRDLTDAMVDGEN